VIHGRLHRAADHACLIPRVTRTASALDRLRGLLGSPPPAPDAALLIVPCSSVHTLFMGYAIDLAFLARDWTILKTVRALKPWRMAACPSAAMVLELATGGLDKLQLTRGLQLEWHDD